MLSPSNQADHSYIVMYSWKSLPYACRRNTSESPISPSAFIGEILIASHLMRYFCRIAGFGECFVWQIFGYI